LRENVSGGLVHADWSALPVVILAARGKGNHQGLLPGWAPDHEPVCASSIPSREEEGIAVPDVEDVVFTSESTSASWDPMEQL